MCGALCQALPEELHSPNGFGRQVLAHTGATLILGSYTPARHFVVSDNVRFVTAPVT